MNLKYDEKEIWFEIEKELGISKKIFGKQISFIKNKFTRDIIFRDVSQAFFLKKLGLSKPAVVISGGVIEELLKKYLESKNIRASKKTFRECIEKCIENDLLKGVISKLSDTIRDFRNIIHLENEISKRYTISSATANIAVSSIFTISNDFVK